MVAWRWEAGGLLIALSGGWLWFWGASVRARCRSRCRGFGGAGGSALLLVVVGLHSETARRFREFVSVFSEPVYEFSVHARRRTKVGLLPPALTGAASRAQRTRRVAALEGWHQDPCSESEALDTL